MQKIINEQKLDFDDVLIRPKRSALSSRSEVNLIREFRFKNSNRIISVVPIIIANMDTTGTFEMAKSVAKHKCMIAIHKHYTVEQYIEFFTTNYKIKDYIFYSTGTSSSDIEKLITIFNALEKANIPYPNICVDVANGYSEKFVKILKYLRDLYKEPVIMAGNVVTGEMVEELIFHGGVDIVKVGIGSGSVCTTRLKTGVGYPQLSAVMECSDAAHGLGGHICSDGGCKVVGDVCKALGGNSDFIMLGSMFAGTDECDGEWTYEYKYSCGNGNNRSEWWQSFGTGNEIEKRKKTLKFYGMSSKEAMEKHHGGVANYRTSEGKCVSVPYKGKAEDILLDIMGGIRSACTYIGATNIKDFGKKTTFIQVNQTHNRIYS